MICSYHFLSCVVDSYLIGMYQLCTYDLLFDDWEEYDHCSKTPMICPYHLLSLFHPIFIGSISSSWEDRNPEKPEIRRSEYSAGEEYNPREGGGG